MSLAAFLRPSKTQLQRNADWLAAAVAVALPWSTTATGICVVLWFLALLPTLQFDALHCEFDALRRIVATPAGGLPILLVALAVLGMLWSDVSWAEAWRGFEPFAKLLIIPLLFFHFSRSHRGLHVMIGFLVSCTVLLIVSEIVSIWPAVPFSIKTRGVPVKDYIAQSGEFTLCAFAAAYVAFDRCRARAILPAITFALLAAAFLHNILYVATGRTSLAVLPILLVLLSLRQFSLKGATALIVAATALIVVVWFSSPYLQSRVTQVPQEVEAYQRDKEVTSAGERLQFWKNSLEIMAEAPVIGHGTGSIRSSFEKAVAGESGLWRRATTNPHNQILAIGIQLGLIGIALLVAMWLSHLLLFRGPGLVAWVGLIVVVQNIVGSLFNSHLFDFVQGWIYVFGAGVAGGMMLRNRAEAEEAWKPQAPGVESLHMASGGAPAQRPL